jgi:hypothetical protein
MTTAHFKGFFLNCIISLVVIHSLLQFLNSAVFHLLANYCRFHSILIHEKTRRPFHAQQFNQLPFLAILSFLMHPISPTVNVVIFILVSVDLQFFMEWGSFAMSFRGVIVESVSGSLSLVK